MKKYLISISILMIISENICAQHESYNLTQDSTFFNEQLNEYKSFLKTYGVDSVIWIEDLIIENDNLNLKLSITGYSDWVALRMSYDSTLVNNFGEFLFLKFIHIMEVPDSIAKLDIFSRTNISMEKLKVRVFKKRNIIKVLEPIIVRSNETFKLSLEESPLITTDKPQVTYDIAKEKIRNFLTNYYKEKGVIWGEAYCRISEDNDRLVFEVTNLDSEVIYDCSLFCYYELIRFDIKFVLDKSNELYINYNLQAKYGSGVFVAPRRGDYKDMEADAKYKPYVEDYQLKMKNEIKKILKNK